MTVGNGPLVEALTDRRSHGRGEGDAVAHRDVVQALLHAGALVEVLGRLLVGAEDAHVAHVAAGGVRDRVGAALLELAHRQAAEAVDRAAGDDGAVERDGDGVALQPVDHVELLDPAEHLVAGTGRHGGRGGIGPHRHRGGHERAARHRRCHEHHCECRPDPAHLHPSRPADRLHSLPTSGRNVAPRG